MRSTNARVALHVLHPQSLDLTEMLQYSLDMELKHVQLDTEALDLLEPHDVARRNMMEELCMEEQAGADHLEKILEKRDLVAVGTTPRSAQKTG